MTPPKILSPTEAGIGEAAARLAAGGLVAFATETVYGLGADATNADAVARIYAAKGRPSFNPLIVHVASTREAMDLAVFDDVAVRLAEAFWPGPLTLVLPLRASAGIARIVSAGQASIALRVPDHQIARSLIRRAARPIAAPSANPSGKISPTRAEHVIQGLGGAVDAVLDAGPCRVGVESTILATGARPRLLRAGGLTLETLENTLGHTIAQDTDPSMPEAPGQLVSHYAPKAHLRLNAQTARPGEVMIGFGPMKAELNLSASGDLTQAAATLFDCLHALDAMDARAAAVSPIPETGLGLAINDRLRRAAADR
ncbi:MAG: L-threonylcarbamoyladenylate synthase [Pseudomonadota bacterium]